MYPWVGFSSAMGRVAELRWKSSVAAGEMDPIWLLERGMEEKAREREEEEDKSLDLLDRRRQDMAVDELGDVEWFEMEESTE